jgi:phytoene dehydrogenase-like protein
MSHPYDAVVVGAGPNGLSAAVTLARAGCRVLVVEAKGTIGGGTRTAELTLPGYLHDVCAAIHPLAVASPFFRGLPLEQYGLEWVYSPAAAAHPLDGGEAVTVELSVEATASQFGQDAAAYRRLVAPLVRQSEALLEELLAPFHLPRRPVLLASFGLKALQPATMLARRCFRGERAQAVFAGMAAHSILPLERPATSGFGLVLTMLAHSVGWPMAKGGSQRIAEALAAYLRSMGGEIETGRPIGSLGELPAAPAYLLDITPRQLLCLAGDRLPDGYRRRLERYRYGPGVCKVDYALDGPIPWQAEACRRAATVHVGGTLAEIAVSERAAAGGEHAERPFVLVAQQSLFDPTRAPAGGHTAWAYCHTPHGSTVDMTEQIEAQIERFAPGFRQRVLARHVRTALQMEAYNPNYVGGDINGGIQDLGQLFTRPVARPNPYTTPVRGLYLCSSATPPGGGVHGMCGYFAAQAALRYSLA